MLDVNDLLSLRHLKTAEDKEAAGRIMARGYADEMQKLCEEFGLVETKEAESEEVESLCKGIEAAFGIE